MSSRRRIVTEPQAGYSGSHGPIGASSESTPSCTSCRMTVEVIDFVMLPIWKSVAGVTKAASGARLTRPATTSMGGSVPGRLTLAEIAVKPSACAWLAR